MPTQKQHEANTRNAQFCTGAKTSRARRRPPRTPSSTASAPTTPLSTTTPKLPSKSPIESPATSTITFPIPLEEATVAEIAFCEIRLEHLVRAETGLLNFSRQLAFQQHSISDSAGNLFHKFDPANHRPGDERCVTNMLLGVAWRDASPEIDRMSRNESRLRVRYEKAIKRLDSLIASRPQQAEPEPAPNPPAPPTPSPPEPRREGAYAAASGFDQKPVLPNEPNFDLTPAESTKPPPRQY